MAFMKDILTRNIPIWEECAATPFVQEVQTGKLPLEKFKRYMIQDSIYLKNYARIYGKAIFHADTLREIQLYYSMLNFEQAKARIHRVSQKNDCLYIYLVCKGTVDTKVIRSLRNKTDLAKALVDDWRNGINPFTS